MSECLSQLWSWTLVTSRLTSRYAHAQRVNLPHASAALQLYLDDEGMRCSRPLQLCTALFNFNQSRPVSLPQQLRILPVRTERRQLTTFWAFTNSTCKRLGSMAPKQATLGYVKQQQTLGWDFLHSRLDYHRSQLMLNAASSSATQVDLRPNHSNQN